MAFHVPEKFRMVKGHMATNESHGNNGIFFVPMRPGMTPLRTIASDSKGWEHVSVSLPARCPVWEEMCFIKELFWDDEDCVLQYHPPKSEYVNDHPYCLHLWRPIGIVLPLPDKIMV